MNWWGRHTEVKKIARLSLLLTAVLIPCFPRPAQAALGDLDATHGASEKTLNASQMDESNPVSAQEVVYKDGNVMVVTQTERSDTQQAVPGEVVVKFRNRLHADEAVRGYKTRNGKLRLPSLPDLDPVFEQFKVKKADKPLHSGKSAHPSDSRLRIVKLTADTLDAGQSKSLIAKLKAHPEIEYAEPNFIAQTQFVPNDPYYASSGAWRQSFQDLWGLQNIAAETAWNFSQGAGVVVAVIDTGIDYNHEDISTNVWTNPGEIPGNNVDDDRNGFVDDVRGWDFVTIDDTPPDNDPIDDFGHGTHVAGTIAAVGNNAVGIIGVAPKARVMALKGLDKRGTGSLTDLANAVYYAADNGAQVINASWGGFGTTPQTLIDAITYAHDIKNVVFVAAAGNNNWDVGSQDYGFWPANIRDSIAISAFDHTDTKASFSNFGAKIDVAAPGGGDTDSTGLIYLPNRSILSLKSAISDPAIAAPGLILANNYLRQAGTSMAAPHVAGVAALVRSLHPEFSAEQVRQAFRRGTDDVNTAGLDTYSGYGRVNATKALAESAPLAVQIASPATGIITGVEQLNILGTANGPNFVSWRLEYGSGAAPKSWALINSSSFPITEGSLATWDLRSVSDGIYTLRLTARDSFGKTYEDRLNITIDQVVIKDPPPNKILGLRGGLIKITGTVSPGNFSNYTIRILRAVDNWYTTSPSKSYLTNPSITLTNGGFQKVFESVLGTWDTTGVPADQYHIELKVTLTNGSVIYEYASVFIDPSLHPGWPQDLGLIGSTAWTLSITDHLGAADVNGDGSADLIVGYGDTIRIFDHSGALLPGWPQSVDPTHVGRLTQVSPAVGDLTGDGKPEIVAAAGQVFIWEANGTLLPGWPKSMGSQLVGLAIDDLNGDGVNEVIGTDAGGQVKVFDNNGISFPGWPKTLSASSTFMVLTPAAIGDVDRDGKKEIAVAVKGSPTDLYLLRFDGTVMPGWPKAINPTLVNFISYSYPEMGDLDGDGDLEVVIGSGDGKVYAFHHDGTDVAGWPQVTQTSEVNSPAIGDIDGDGRPEVVAGIRNTIYENGFYVNYLYAWHGDGAPVAGWPVKNENISIPYGWGFGPPAIADINGDGYPDVIAASNSFYARPFPLNAFHHNGTKLPGFPKPTANLDSFLTNTVAIADMDNDGLLEMAWIDAKANLYMWDLAATAAAPAPWPMFRHDARHTGLSVTGAPPTLAYSSESGYGTVGVNPASGMASTLFTYKVIYTDTENTPPTLVHACIDGICKAMNVDVSATAALRDGSYTNGEQYIYTAALAAGAHSYYFTAADGTTSVNLPATGKLSGPTVSGLTITTNTLPNGTFGTAYSQALAATRGISPYSWSSTTLPAGLSLDVNAGIISGTPSAIGLTGFSATVTDAASAVFSKALSINVGSVDMIMATVSKTATTVGIGHVFAVTNVERNQGTTPAVSTSVAFYLSLDATITTADIKLTGTRSVIALAAMTSSASEATFVIVPDTVPPGIYYVGACADVPSVQAETNEDNNCKSAGTITVIRAVNLQMSAVSKTATVVGVGRTFTITNTEKNVGTTHMTATSNTVKFYLSTDATINTLDIALGSRVVSRLLAGQSSPSLATTVVVPTTVAPRVYYVGACADVPSVQIESIESDNCKVALGTINVVRNVDLVMSAVSTTATTIKAGGNLVISNTEKNQGTAAMLVGTTNRVNFYLSTDATITSADILLSGNRTVAALAAGASSTASITVTVPATVLPRVYYIGAIADGGNQLLESVENNNAREGGTITIN